MAPSPGSKGCQSDKELVVVGAELHPADQPGIWLRVWNHLMPETLFAMGHFGKTIHSSFTDNWRKILTGLPLNLRRVSNTSLGDISARQKFEVGEKARQHDAASDREN